MDWLQDRMHNFLAHPREQAYVYEVHSANALLVNDFSDQTLINRRKLACDEVGITLGFEQAERAKHAVAKAFSELTDEHVLIKWEDGVAKPLAASIDAEKNPIRAKRLEGKLKKLIKEYEIQSGHRLREVTVHHG